VRVKTYALTGAILVAGSLAGWQVLAEAPATTSATAATGPAARSAAMPSPPTEALAAGYPRAEVARTLPIDPVGLVAQSYKETGAGAFGGKVSPRFYNTAGIKVRHTDIFPGTTDDDRPLAHQMVSNWEVGAAAHAQHVRAYAGCPISGELIVDPRYVWVNGKFKLTEWSDLSGNWAPLPDLWVRSRRVDAETHNLTYMVVPEGDRLG
jgi:hypothetical protein